MRITELSATQRRTTARDPGSAGGWVIRRASASGSSASGSSASGSFASWRAACVLTLVWLLLVVGRTAIQAAPGSAGSSGNKSASGAVDEAQQQRQEEAQRQRDFEERRQRMFERIWNEQREHEPGVYERNNSSVKMAFRDAVATARHSTVRVLSDGKQVAMGAVVRSDGLIVTKASELKGKLEVELSDDKRLTATSVATDPRNDLALLRVPAHDLAPISWSTDSQVSIGNWLATCGPGLDPLAVGVVSVAAREIRPPRGILGVVLSDDSDGPKVEEVLSGSGASEAGLKAGDVIQKINDRKVADHQAAVRMLGRMKAGDRVRLRLSRDGKGLDLTAKLGTTDMGGRRVDRFQMMNMLGGPLSDRRAGFTSAIQHDTVLLPQDCGGPVVDVDGRAIGVNIARAGRVESFAIPASIVQKFVNSQPKAAEPQPVSHKPNVQ